jgi:hypothetical protein
MVQARLRLAASGVGERSFKVLRLLRQRLLVLAVLVLATPSPGIANADDVHDSGTQTAGDRDAGSFDGMLAVASARTEVVAGDAEMPPSQGESEGSHAKWMIGDSLITDLSSDEGRPSLAVAPNGDLWVAVEDADPSDPFIRIYRSTDGGRTWSFAWSAASMPESRYPSLAYAENGIGDAWLFLVYEVYKSMELRSLHLFRFDPANPGAPGDMASIQDNIATPGLDAIEPRLVTDNEEFPNPYLYLTYSVPLEDTTPVYYTRSTDLGMTWSIPLDVTGGAQGTSWRSRPDIAFGAGSVYIPFVKPGAAPADSDNEVWVAVGANLGTAWGPPIQVTHSDDDYFWPAAAAAHNAAGTVVVAFSREYSGASDADVHAVFSTDGGSSWSIESTLPWTFDDEATVDLAVSRSGSGSRFHAVFWRNHDVIYTTSGVATPSAWSAGVRVNECNALSGVSRIDVAVDPSKPRASEAAVAWTDTRNAYHDAYFDSAVLFGSGVIFADGFELGSTLAWSVTQP